MGRGSLNRVCLIKHFAVDGTKNKWKKIMHGLLMQQVLISRKEYLCTSKVGIIHDVRWIFKMSGKYLIVLGVLPDV